MIVKTVDAGGNYLETLDITSHNVTATIVTTAILSGDMHVARTYGAALTGTTSMLSSEGFIVFVDLALTATAPSGSRDPNANNDITYGDATRGLYAADSKYLIQFSADLPAGRCRLTPGGPRLVSALKAE